MKGKSLYLSLSILLFVILWVPYFQNMASSTSITFFVGSAGFTSLYPRLLFLGMIEGCFILLFINSWIKSNQTQEPKKFDLS